MTKALSLVLFGGLALGAHASGATVSASVSRSVHPVLIRNEFNEILVLRIDVGGEAATLREARFELKGTDDLADLESLELIEDGAKGAFTGKRFGAASGPERTVAFQDDRELSPGEHRFRLSCRLKPGASLLRRVGATCAEIETSAGKITPKDASPDMTHRIGVAVRRAGEDGIHTSRIPALTITPKGTLLCVYDMRRRAGRDLQEDIDIGLNRSRDGGQTWEPARVVMDMGEYGGLPQTQNGCSDPGIIVDQKTGEIFCFAVWMNGKPGKHQWKDDGSEPGYEIGKSAQILMVRSKDDGLTWSKPENLTRKLKKAEWWLFAPSPQSGINLPDGTLVIPAQGRDEKGREFPTLMVSRDHGDTWTAGTPAYIGGNECQAAILGDGSIMLNCRNDLERFRSVFVTKDLGKSWTPHPTNRNTLIEPNCNGSLMRFDLTGTTPPRHVLIFANPQSTKARTHHTIQISFDDGMTWPESHRLLLDEGRGAGYPSLTRIDDRHVGLVYEGSRAHVVFEKFAIDDLLRPKSTR